MFCIHGPYHSTDYAVSMVRVPSRAAGIPSSPVPSGCDPPLLVAPLGEEFPHRPDVGTGKDCGALRAQVCKRPSRYRRVERGTGSGVHDALRGR
eukprot:scaffold149_cov315-Pinguiococcus_pyrenoidosus.AAC.67